MSDYGTPPPNQPPPTSRRPGVRRAGAVGAAAEGVLRRLFDFGFEHFITPIIVKIVYVSRWRAGEWLVSWHGLPADASLASSSRPRPGPVILYLAFIRMTLEFYLAIVRMSQDIHERLR